MDGGAILQHVSDDVCGDVCGVTEVEGKTC